MSSSTLTSNVVRFPRVYKRSRSRKRGAGPSAQIFEFFKPLEPDERRTINAIVRALTRGVAGESMEEATRFAWDFIGRLPEYEARKRLVTSKRGGVECREDVAKLKAEYWALLGELAWHAANRKPPAP